MGTVRKVATLVTEEYVLPQHLQSPSAARVHARAFLADERLGQPHLLTDVLVVVSELVTNAVLYGRVPIVLSLVRDLETLRIEVSDADPQVHAVKPHAPNPSDPTGRGLQIVQSLTRAWGVTPQAHGGKTVWAVMPLND